MQADNEVSVCTEVEGGTCAFPIYCHRRGCISLTKAELSLNDKAATFVPPHRVGWWGGPDKRERCSRDDKVVFADEPAARKSAEAASDRGTPMKAYLGKCGHWHTARRTRRNP